MKYELKQLPYPYNALEPYIDAETMEIHHTKHHQAYINKVNPILEKYPEFENKTLEEILSELNNIDIPENEKIILKNHGGGTINHNLFWEIMGPQKEIDESLKNKIEKTFGSIDEFKKIFSETALNHFGSGWAWLVKDSEGKLKIYSLPNQDSPCLLGHTPIIGLDVWEHAYYLKYQNKRGAYIQNWWNVLKIL